MQLFKFVEYTWENWLHCKLCEKKFSSKTDFICHMSLEKHSNESLKICTECQVTIDSASEFLDHVISKHPNNRSECLICGTTVKNKCNYFRHIASHFPEKPYKCGNCGKDFKRKDKMKSHERKCAPR